MDASLVPVFGIHISLVALHKCFEWSELQCNCHWFLGMVQSFRFAISGTTLLPIGLKISIDNYGGLNSCIRLSTFNWLRKKSFLSLQNQYAPLCSFHFNLIEVIWPQYSGSRKPSALVQRYWLMNTSNTGKYSHKGPFHCAILVVSSLTEEKYHYLPGIVLFIVHV